MAFSEFFSKTTHSSSHLFTASLKNAESQSLCFLLNLMVCGTFYMLGKSSQSGIIQKIEVKSIIFFQRLTHPAAFYPFTVALCFSTANTLKEIRHRVKKRKERCCPDLKCNHSQKWSHSNRLMIV